MCYKIRHHIYIGVSKAKQKGKHSITISKQSIGERTVTIDELPRVSEGEFGLITFNGTSIVEYINRRWVVIYAPKNVDISVKGEWINHHKD